MHSFSTIGFVLVGLASLATCQTINPDTVDISTRQTWCTTQKSSCPLICLQIPGASGEPISNDCTASDLVFSCVCSNGISPNASQYSQTIPYFECTEYGNQCVNNCGQGNSACASACRTNNPCGAQNPIRVNLTTSSSTMSATAAASTAGSSGGADYTGFGGAAATTSASSSGTGTSAASTLAISIGQAYGFGVVFLGLFTGFALVL